MKRRTIVLLIALAFVLLACGVAYAAELGIFDLTVQDGVSLTPQKADETEIVSETVGDVEFYAGAERLGLTYSTGIESGKEYLVMVLRGEDATPTADNIVYIDQLTALGDEIEFNLYPSLLESGEEYHVYLSTNAEGSDGLTEIASFRYGWVGSADKSALADAISLAEALEGSDYTAESWAALQDALAAAKEVMADENATQDEVNAAAAALQAAIDALEANTYEPFTLSDSEITVPAQSTYTLKVEGAGTVTWSSSNEAVATVDQTGVVSAKLYGTAVISVTDGTTTLECTVNVLFSDVTKTSLYYYKPVYWAAENNITVGYNSGPYIGQFGVGLNCERRQLMLFLWRYAGSPTKDANGKTYPDAKTLFNDVGAYSASSGTNKAIAWAYT